MRILENSRLVTGLASRFPFKLLVFGALAVGAVFYGFLWNHWSDAGALLQHFGYYALTVTVLWWLYALVQLEHARTVVRRVFTWPSIKAGWPVYAVIILISAVAWLTVPYSYKILYDELVLQSTAFNMHFFREVGTVATGYNVEGVFRSLNIYVDKRPFFYPYLVSVIHDLTGFRAMNGFVLNTLLMPLVLGVFYKIAKTFGGSKVGLAGMISFGATSLLAQNANGMGMEMLNVCMILITLAVAINYLEEPGEKGLSALVLSCILLAQTRYESTAYVVPVALIILEGWRRTGRIILPTAGLVAPVLLIPCALHNVYLSGMPSLWELHENTTSRFDVSFLAGNLTHALRYFGVVSDELLNSVWLSILGFVAIGWALKRMVFNVRGWRSAMPTTVAIVLIGAFTVGNLVLLMFYYWGQLDDVLVFRLALPLNIIHGLAIAWALGRLPSQWISRVAGWVIAGGVIFYFGWGLPASARHGQANYIATEITWGEDWVARQPAKSRLIVVASTSLNWFLKKTAALSFSYAAQRADRIAYHMAAGTFQEVLVFQYYRPTGPDGGFVLDPRTELPASFVLEPVFERSMGLKLIRISRVVEIRPAQPAGEAVSGPASGESVRVAPEVLAVGHSKSGAVQ